MADDAKVENPHIQKLTADIKNDHRPNFLSLYFLPSTTLAPSSGGYNWKDFADGFVPIQVSRFPIIFFYRSGTGAVFWNYIWRVTNLWLYSDYTRVYLHNARTNNVNEKRKQLTTHFFISPIAKEK